MSANPIDYWYQKYLAERLTWEDIAKIDHLIIDVNNEMAVDSSKEISRQNFYEGVLRRFNEAKNERQRKDSRRD